MTRNAALYTINPTAVFLGLSLVALNLTRLFGSLAALGFLIFCMAVVAMRPARILADARSAIWLWALVFWCIISLLWSNAPSLTLRYGLQLGFTFLIAISAASRMSLTSFVKVVTLCGLVTGMLCMLFNQVNPGGAWLGVFGSKNALAQFATVNVLVGFALLLDGRASRSWRRLALIVLILGAFLLVRAESIGALVATVMSCVIMTIVALLSFAGPTKRLLLFSLAALLGLATAFAIATNFELFSIALLDLTGKDVTLTGRTLLWGIAFEEISKQPLLGQGYKGYWVQGNPMAEELWREFGIASKQGFHFHNTLISNAVEVGLIGVALQAGIFYFAFFVTVRAAVRAPSAETLFLLGFMIRQFILMQSEVVFFSQFDVVTLLTVMAVVYAIRIVKGEESTGRYGYIPPQKWQAPA